MRLDELNALSFHRVVISQDGLDHPSARHILLKERLLILPAANTLPTRRLYPRLGTYQPFRFFDLRNMSSTFMADEDRADQALSILRTVELSIATHMLTKDLGITDMLVCIGSLL